LERGNEGGEKTTILGTSVPKNPGRQIGKSEKKAPKERGN